MVSEEWHIEVVRAEALGSIAKDEGGRLLGIGNREMLSSAVVLGPQMRGT